MTPSFSWLYGSALRKSCITCAEPIYPAEMGTWPQGQVPDECGPCKSRPLKRALEGRDAA